uniref:RBR-type E3 ubiquitin transferase n=1 Tax=Culicoides sonorensis TaxID=179676 RepID=A0A336N0W9_CULSO
MQSHQKPSKIIIPNNSTIERDNEQLGSIIPCKSPIISSEFEFLNPLIKSGKNHTHNKKYNTKNNNNNNNNNQNNANLNKLKRTVSDFGKIASGENIIRNNSGIISNDHQKKSSLKVIKSDYSLSKIAQQQQKELNEPSRGDGDGGCVEIQENDEILPLLLDTNTTLNSTNNNNNLTIKVITDDKNVLLFTKKNINGEKSSSSSVIGVNTTTSEIKIKESAERKFQKRQNLQLPLNGISLNSSFNNNTSKSDRIEKELKSESISPDTDSSGKKKNSWRHSWYAPESSSLHNLAGVKNKQHLNGTRPESVSLLEPHHNSQQFTAHHNSLSSSRIPRTNTVCIVPSGQSADTVSIGQPTAAPIPRKRKFEQFLKSLVGRRPSKEPPSPPLISSPEITVSKCPSEYNLSRLSRTKLNVSTTSLNSVHHKLWSVVPLLRKNGSCSSLSVPKRPAPFGGADYIGLRKCETVLALTNSNSSSGGPIRPLNRLRNNCGSSIATCSRCSSLLSLAAAGSKYSLNLSGGGFIPVSSNNCSNNAILPQQQQQQQILISSVVPESPTFTVIGATGSTYFSSSTQSSLSVCKLCLGECKAEKMTKISQCGCQFCTECMRAYVEFEITEGAYEVSCPDAMCPAQGVISIAEITALAAPSLVDKHHRYRLNRGEDKKKCLMSFFQ